MAMGTSVLQIRIELIFRRCWNLITPWRSAGASPPMSSVPRIWAADALARAAESLPPASPQDSFSAVASDPEWRPSTCPKSPGAKI
jgi:hypothetical protein